MITLKDVAREARLDISTISHILHRQDPRYSLATRQRVEKVAKQLGYRPDTLARSLVHGKTNSIGVVGHDFITSLSMERVQAIAATAHSQGYHMFLAGGGMHSPHCVEKELIEGLLSRRVDGLIIFVGSKYDAAFYRLLKKQGISLVLCIQSPVRGLPCVVANLEQGYFEATCHLLKLGHRRIALAIGNNTKAVPRNRFQGYQRALNSHGIQLDEDLLPSVEMITVPEVYEFTREQIRKRRPPTAIIYSNDEQALAGLRAIYEAGMEVPKEISVIGCNDLSIAEYAFPPLTTVRQPRGELGLAAIELLMKQINRVPLGKKTTIQLASKLVVRQSTGPAPRRKIFLSRAGREETSGRAA